MRTVTRRVIDMTIDEAIKKHKKLKIHAERTNDKRGAFYSAEEHGQLTEWLEELKFIRQWKSDVMGEFCKYDVSSFEELVTNTRTKAVDDFTEKLKAKCDGMIKEEWNSNVAPISWAEAYADFKDDTDEITEQLKAGGENESK